MAYSSRLDLYSRKQLGNEAMEDQFNRLNLGHSLMLESLFTVRNAFCFYLENHNTNGYRPLGSTSKAISQAARLSDSIWPYNAFDNLTVVLVDRKEEPLNFFYTNCRQRVCHWSIPPTMVVGESLK